MQHTHLDEDLYCLLGVDAAASADEIRRAYRKLAMIWHPDRNISADAEETFKRIRLAYEVLREPKRRSDYDRSYASHARRPQGTHGRQASAAQAEAPSRRAPNLRRHVSISLEEQLHGCRARLRLTRTEYCRHCGGSGHGNVPPVACGTCRGSGYVRNPLGLFSLFRASAVACGDCDGKGTIRPTCDACAGTGMSARKIGHLHFEVPAGIRPGASLRVRGHGRRGRSGESPGDLLVHVGVAPHPLFEPDFPDLRCEIPVSVFRALAGGTLEVPTLGAALSVPLSSEPLDGAELRIAGHGMLDGASGRRGDLLVRLRLIRPQRLSDAHLALLAELEGLAADDPALTDWLRRRHDAERLRSRSKG